MLLLVLGIFALREELERGWQIPLYRKIYRYSRAHQVMDVEPSIIDRNRLSVAENHKVRKLRIFAENSVKK